MLVWGLARGGRKRGRGGCRGRAVQDQDLVLLEVLIIKDLSLQC